MQQLISIVVLSATGSDLFSLPLVFATLLLAFGVVVPPESVTWMGAWWMVGVAGAILAAEVSLDTMLDRQQHFAKKVWPHVQMALSGMVTVMVVLSLGRGLSPAEIAAAIGAGLVATGIIKHGLVERFRSVADHIVGD
jgi:hypothetical protein